MSEPIRVLQVIGRMNRAGAETMIMNLYRKIDKSKIQFDFVVHTNEKCDYDNEILSLGGRIYRVPRFTGKNIVKYKNVWNDFFNEHREYKIVHGHIGSSASIYLSIAKKYGIYTIAHSHSSSMGEGVKGAMYKFFSYPTRYIADYYFACSNLAGISRYGKRIVNSNKYSILKNSIELEKFIYNEEVRKIKRKELKVEDKYVIGHVGRFIKSKNHKFLIEVFKELNKINDKAVLLLVGDGDLKEDILNQVKICGLDKKVIFTGIRQDVNELLQVMDVFVFPSFYEGLGLAIIEAQAAGLPCLISNSIPDEVCITPLVKKLSIKESPKKWAYEINKISTNRNIDISESISKSGYNIDKSVLELEKFYLEKVSNLEVSNCIHILKSQ